MNISDRLSSLIKEKDISIRALEQLIGCSNGVLARCISKKTDISSQWVSKIVEKFQDVNPGWLLTGEGSMFKNQPEYSTFTKIPPHQQPINKTRPHIPLNASAGSLSFDAKSVLESQCEHYPLIPGLSNYDFTITISGDSMEPQFRHGDIVACRLQRNEAPIQGGHTYVVDSIDGVVLKRIFDNGDSIRCHSDNPAYPDFTIPKSELNRMALVIGMIRTF